MSDHIEQSGTDREQAMSSRGERMRMAHTIRKYLQTFATTSPLKGRRTREWVEQRVALLDESITAQDDPLAKLLLVQKRMDLRQTLAHLVGDDQRESLQAEFIKVAAEYSEWKGISRAAWLEVGVPKKVLDQAGVT